jgi:hypothetical protein
VLLNYNFIFLFKLIAKSKVTANKLTEGFRTCYNFIRPHQALNGLTPSQVANIELNPDRNKWLSLLKQSLKNKV